MNFPTQLRSVQSAGEDFEWYPTTAEIIAALRKDIAREIGSDDRRYRHSGPSTHFLDIGAGNGKVINALRDLDRLGDTFAIEKSHTLLDLLPAETFILGCDFWKTSLIDKDIGIIFSNPPYSTFAEWSLKILREVQPGTLVYLVIPDRWEKSEPLTREIKSRKATTKVLGTFDFQSSEDRQARARVHLLKITIGQAERYSSREDAAEDPFTRFFDETFTYPEAEKEIPFTQQLQEAQIVHRLNFIEALCRLHDLRIQQLQRNYQAVCNLSADILEEFDIKKGGLIKSLKMKLDTCKKEYWQRLFDGMKEINTRLTSSSRETIQRKLQAQTGIDFNRENAYAVVLWTVKNANQYFDSQLVETYEKMVCAANVDNYVSNKRIFKRDRFSYHQQQDSEKSTHYRLKVGHRMVLDRVGGLESRWGSQKGISNTACKFIGDLITVAHNLGFVVIDPGPREHEYNDSSARVIRFRTAEGQVESLIRTRAFQNNNMHMQFHPDFIHALNVHHGRLKGWLRNDDEAARELEIPAEVATKLFTAPGFRLTSSSLALMAPAEPERGIHPASEAPGPRVLTRPSFIHSSSSEATHERSPEPLRIVTPPTNAFADF